MNGIKEEGVRNSSETITCKGGWKKSQRMSNKNKNTKDRAHAALSVHITRQYGHINQMQQTAGSIVVLHPYKVTCCLSLSCLEMPHSFKQLPWKNQTLDGDFLTSNLSLTNLLIHKMTHLPLTETSVGLALPFRAPVVVVALNRCCGFLEANVVESSEGCAADVFDRVVRNQKLLLNVDGQGEKQQQMQFRGDLLQHKVWLHLGSTLPSTSWKYSPSSSGPRSQNHPSWTTLHTGRRPETCPCQKKETGLCRGKQPAVQHLCTSWMHELTQCLRSTSSSASHFRVRNGRFLLMISPAKNVVRVGYSCERECYRETVRFCLFWRSRTDSAALSFLLFVS